nr:MULTISPECIES: redox-sensing transcriptional repressor Rex [unclassified Actinopolyspora]
MPRVGVGLVTTGPSNFVHVFTNSYGGRCRVAGLVPRILRTRSSVACTRVPGSHDFVVGAVPNRSPLSETKRRVDRALTGHRRTHQQAGRGRASVTAHGEGVRDGDAHGAEEPASEQQSSDGVAIPEPQDRAKAIPEAAVARLAVYLRVLSGFAEQEVHTVSSEELAVAAGVNSAKLRKDLSYIGSYGTRGVGYEVAVLIGQIERTLGLTQQHSVAVIGIGNLGHALANYGGFPSRGFPVAALFDLDPDLMGVPVGGIPVDHVDDIPRVCAERDVTIGAIATPAKGAQEVCDRLVQAGVRCVLNFAPVVLQVPEEVEVRKVDLAVEMQILSFHVARRSQETSESTTSEAEADGAAQSKTRDVNAGVNPVDGMVVRP